jgi:hypothetical protein
VNISGIHGGEQIGAEARKLLMLFRRQLVFPVAFCTLFSDKILNRLININ